MANQEKGNLSVNFGGVTIANLAEDAIAYDIGELGDTLSSLNDVVHIQRSKTSVVTSITLNIPKGSSGLGTLTTLINTGIIAPLTINDKGVGFKGVMISANATQITLGNTTGSNDVEIVSFIFKGNLQIIEI